MPALPELVCNITLLARALGLKAERLAKRARDDRVSCIQSQHSTFNRIYPCIQDTISSRATLGLPVA